MPSILVVEPDAHYVERIQAALGAEGWSVRVVPSVDQALHTSPAPPDLVLAAADLPGFEVLVFSFSRRSGGPGVVGLLPEGGSGGGEGADARIAKPFTGEQVVLAARQALIARRPSGTGGMPVVTATPEHKLTSKEIFGDVLAEVEAGQTPRPVIAPPRAVPSPAATPPSGNPGHAGHAGDDVQQRLEKTLSGMLTADPRPRPAAPPPPPRRVETAANAALAANQVDALLNKTLSNLELGSKARPAARSAAPPAPPAAPPVAEGTGVRKGRAVGDFDFAELEELARTSTRPGIAAPSPAAPPRPAAPVPAPAFNPEPLAFAPPAPAPVPPPVAPTGASVFPAAPSMLPMLPMLDAAATQRIPVFAEESGGQSGERFGQYTLLERIAVGGMAEVWKARMRGVEGFQKTVAIKRILPHMTDNAEFVGMFIDEAKLAAQLTHPNIVHIYDLGKIGRDYYIAMEYVDGRDLRSLLNAGRRKGMPLPLGLSLLIAARLASALDYAHRKRDFEDRELGLVHRDVSPQNVLLTGEGDVKLCDFGIAKAVSKASQTQMGALKGKLQYMSPEQAWGRPVDGRSDLFSLGAVLFEMVTGERLFAGDSEVSVLEAVRQGRVRTPRQVDPSLPREVDEIVMRALALEPQDRFQSAGEMKQRLEGALAALSPSTGPADLAIYIQRVLDAEVPQSSAVSAPAPAIAVPPEPAPAPPPSAPPAAAAPAATAAVAAMAAAFPPPPTAGEETAAPVEAVAPVGRVAVEEEGGRKSRTLLYAAIAALVVIAILTFWFLNHRKAAAAPPPGPVATSGSPAAPLPSAANPAQSPAGPAVPGAPAAAGTSAVDLKAMVDRQLAGKEEELRKKNEAKLKELEKQVAAAAAGTKPLPAPPAAAAKPAVPEPAPQAAPPHLPEPEKAEPKAPPPVVPAPAPAAEAAKHEAEPAAPAAPRTKVGELVEMGAGVAPPQLVSSPKPGYPPMARTLRVEGVVVCAVLVDENGEVQDVKIVESIKKNVGLNEAAVSAARASHYKPASKDGVRVKMWTRLKIPFKL
jgi:TonB family protein